MLPPPAAPDFLQTIGLGLLFFGGKGGVGKTTCACAAAIAIARRRAHHSVLLVSTDPAHSVTDAVADLRPPPNLQIRQLNADAALEAFRERYRPLLREISQRGTLLDNDDVDALLEVALPGLDELAAYLTLAHWVEQTDYDCIVVDTAPTGHTLRLLAMPDLARRWLSALDALLAKHRWMRKRFCGDFEPDHLDRFLLDLERSRGTLAALLRNPARCRFIPVTLAERMSIAETRDLLATLQSLQMPVTELVVNRLAPVSQCADALMSAGLNGPRRTAGTALGAGPGDGSGAEVGATRDRLCPICATERHAQAVQLGELRAMVPQARLLGLPLLGDEPRAEALGGLWERLIPLTATPSLGTTRGGVSGAAPDAVSHAAAAKVEHPAPLPPSALKLLVLAGKGGVGKSTLACATALHLNQARPGQRLLLFSTDPAHSLGDALQQPVGPEPTRIRPGLDAQEVDAETAFAAIRHDYQLELEQLLANRLGSLELAFDRQVMARLLDLAPPGLDEIMALTMVIDHLDADRYDLIILDAAPSGHLLRLLQLPELTIDWLKLFFRLLLKYRDLLRLPRLSERLLSLSRATKRLRALLTDPDRARVQLVTVATALAIAETEDLRAALAALAIAVHVLVVNQLTPPGPPDCRCALCDRRRQHESEQIRAVACTASPHQTLLYRQPSEPAGVAGLAALGAAFYGQTAGGCEA